MLRKISCSHPSGVQIEMTQQNKLRNKNASSRDHILDIGFQSDARNVSCLTHFGGQQIHTDPRS